MIVVEREKCCACRSCLQICPAQAISVKYDKLGFEQIEIDEYKCINCKKCKNVCPIINRADSVEESTVPEHISKEYKCGSAYALAPESRHQGSSGGLFGILANHVLSINGFVYGAAFDEKLHLSTLRVGAHEELSKLYKSKYLLCDTTDAFGKIKADLENNSYVLYCSSPCQISALKAFLGKDYDKLFCIDFICHGVGSQRQFEQSIQYTEQKNSIEIKAFNFREKIGKRASSHYYYYYYYYDLHTGRNGNKSDIYMTFPYYFAYAERLTCRDICYTCPFASENRMGDITIGDFHEINQYEPTVDKFEGASMFIINTAKGNELWKCVADKMHVRDYDWEIIKHHNRFSGPEKPPKRREEYLNFASIKYIDAVSLYLNYKRDWRFYYYHLPRWLRDLGRKMLGRNA